MTADPTPEHLRYAAQYITDDGVDELLTWAAAEIERLQTALEHVVDAASYVDAVMIAEGALSDDR